MGILIFIYSHFLGTQLGLKIRPWFSQGTKEILHLEQVIILKWIVEKWGWVSRLEFPRLREGSVKVSQTHSEFFKNLDIC
jgi:hypothetical protein